MAKTKFLNKRCAWCNELLHASVHVSRNERAIRDAKKEYCGGVCAAKHKSAAGPLGDAFASFTGVPNRKPIMAVRGTFKPPGRQE